MRPFVLIFTFFVGLFMSPAPVTACSCAGSGLPCEAFWNASAVFSGEVQEAIVIAPESVKVAQDTEVSELIYFSVEEIPEMEIPYPKSIFVRGTKEFILNSRSSK